MVLSRPQKPRVRMDLRRRDFLVRFCQGAGAAFVPHHLWRFSGSPWLTQDSLQNSFSQSSSSQINDSEIQTKFHLTLRYRSERPVDAVLQKVQPGQDEFITEKYAESVAAILAKWSAGLIASASDIQIVASALGANFRGASVVPVDSRIVRAGLPIEVRRNRFTSDASLYRDEFLHDFRSSLNVLSKILVAEFQIVAIDVSEVMPAAQMPARITTRIRYEIVGTGNDFHREQRIGEWELTWEPSSSGEFLVTRWIALDETLARSRSPVYVDVTSAPFGVNSSYSAQLQHGTDYWRTILDGACGIDIYGHNGISVADIDNDGFDDIYICQPAGLPNRLYRNRGDGTFEDITETSGLGVLENTACALFADFNNDGWQDVIIVRANGPLLFLNEGNGKFRAKPDAFQFANPPQGTFTGASVADYDRDGWLDIYFCLYAYYQGTGQYKYPSPYHDAENGPPNFLLRNQRDGTFRDVTAESGLNQNNTRYSFCCAWNDFDRDGWPDLYVVNDFGRKNLYRNNGDGTFTDVAPQAGVEDVGAGMSVGWFDYDNDDAEDLYVANMWTAAGERVSQQKIFKENSLNDIRFLYQKHAAGNSLFRNRQGTRDESTFENVTEASGIGIGRWSWSSDAIDFDHDGFPDLYVTNGMISGPSRYDLNSFFWRQVVAKSPDDARANKEYELGWSAINELIRSDGSWSGYERNIFYANNRDGTFSDVSAVAGLDFIEDARSFALADLDHDGRFEIFLKNRNAPQLRLLKNVVRELPPSIVFRLQGASWNNSPGDPQKGLQTKPSGFKSKKTNRDAIGASITIETKQGTLTRTVQAGSGFLSQHSKEIFFGVGNAKDPIRATIRWPSGLVQHVRNLPLNHRIWIEEGSEPSRIEPFQPVLQLQSSPKDLGGAEVLSTKAETWLLTPYPAPDFSLSDFSGKTRTLREFRGKAVLLNLWSTASPDFNESAKALIENSARWARWGLQPIAVLVQGEESGVFSRGNNGAGLILRGDDDFAAIYNIVFRQLYDRHRDLTLPTSFLIDASGDIVKAYQGRIDPAHIEHDFQHLPESDAERIERALPFSSTGHTLEFGRNYLSCGSLFFQRGYLDEAETAFQQAFRDDPASAEALYGIGSVYLNQNKNAEARDAFERTVKLQASYPDTLTDAWNNLGVIATRENRIDDSIQCFQQALRLNPHHLLVLDNLGNAYRLEKRWDDARKVLEQALEVDSQDAEANYSLGMVFAQTEQNDKAYEYLQRALKARPDYPEVLNNLGVLYMVTQRPDEAAASFEQCIRVAPTFAQAYLNLARVYVLDGARDKARGVLEELLEQHPDDAQAKQMLDQLQ
jgi:tetratricopeptide (TPR) repeat protein